jgi:hypothetical protein
VTDWTPNETNIPRFIISIKRIAWLHWTSDVCSRQIIMAWNMHCAEIACIQHLSQNVCLPFKTSRCNAIRQACETTIKTERNSYDVSAISLRQGSACMYTSTDELICDKILRVHRRDTYRLTDLHSMYLNGFQDWSYNISHSCFGHFPSWTVILHKTSLLVDHCSSVFDTHICKPIRKHAHILNFALHWLAR